MTIERERCHLKVSFDETVNGVPANLASWEWSRLMPIGVALKSEAEECRYRSQGQTCLLLNEKLKFKLKLNSVVIKSKK